MPRHWIDCFALIMDRGGYLTHRTFESKWFYYQGDAVATAIRFELANQVMKYSRSGGKCILMNTGVPSKFQCLDFNVPEILEPLMLHDEVLLRSILETPTFLACSEIPTPYIYWPEGLRILLQSGKLLAEHALNHACSVGILESVTLLLSNRWFYIQSIHLKSAACGQNSEIMKLIVNALLRRGENCSL